MKNIRCKIRNIEKTSISRIEKWFCNNVLESFSTSDDCTFYIRDILKNGCQNGVISELIYYKDVYPFFDEYYLEIQEEGATIILTPDIKSQLTWLAVERTALMIADKLDLS